MIKKKTRTYNHAHFYVALVIMPFALLIVCAPGWTQNIAGSSAAKLGNATAFPNSNFMNNPLSADPAVTSSRHNRRSIGSTGIGGSTVGTENVTSESGPVTQPIYNPATRSPAMSQTSNYSYYNSSQLSPALNSVTTFSNFGFASATSGFDSNFSSSSGTGLDAIPSFNRNTIIQGYSHGGKSWTGP